MPTVTGRRDLAALNFTRQGNVVSYTRTIVRLDGAEARNGPVDRGRFVSLRDDASIELLSRVTCGDEVMSTASAPLIAGDGEGAVE